MKTTNTMRGGWNLILVLVAITALGIGATALAQGPGPRGGGRGQGDGTFGGGPRIERLQARLDLSDEQAAAIAELHEKAREKNVSLRKDLMRLRNEKRGLMLADEPSADKVVDLTRRIGEVRTQMQVNRVEARLATRKLLTAEQRDKMLLMGEGGRQGRGGPGHGGPGRGGDWQEGGRRGGGGADCDGPGQGRGRGQGQGQCQGPRNGRGNG